MALHGHSPQTILGPIHARQREIKGPPLLEADKPLTRKSRFDCGHKLAVNLGLA